MNKIFFKKIKKFILLKEIYNICNYSEKKILNKKILGVNNIKDAKGGEVIFFNDLKYESEIKFTKAIACIVNKKLAKSSGLPDWDAAVLRAIDDTGSLPKDENGTVPKSIMLIFRPKD